MLAREPLFLRPSQEFLGPFPLSLSFSVPLSLAPFQALWNRVEHRGSRERTATRKETHERMNERGNERPSQGKRCEREREGEGKRPAAITRSEVPLFLSHSLSSSLFILRGKTSSSSALAVLSLFPHFHLSRFLCSVVGKRRNSKRAK